MTENVARDKPDPRCASVCGIPESQHQIEEHPFVRAASSPAAPGLREALDSAVEEFDNILWEDIWRSLSDHGDRELASWSRKYVAYLRDDIDKARAALGGSGSPGVSAKA